MLQLASFLTLVEKPGCIRACDKPAITHCREKEAGNEETQHVFASITDSIRRRLNDTVWPPFGNPTLRLCSLLGTQ